MRTALLASLAGLLLLVSPAQLARANDLVILSAAAVRPALVQLPAMVEKASGDRVTVNFGNATAISKQVIDGARVDLVILPPPQLKSLIEAGHLAEQTRADLGVVRLGVAIRAGSAALPVGTAEGFKAALLAAASFGMPDPADGSTSSQHLVKLLAQLGIADAMRPRLRYFKDGTEALHAIAKGELTLTVAPMTSIRVVAGVALAGPLPDALQSTTVYTAALSRTSAASPPAQALMAMLTAPAFAAVLRDRGIDPVN
jgi:molybdate transport system substrate-binding protein